MILEWLCRIYLFIWLRVFFAWVESLWRLGILAWVQMVWLGFWLVLCFGGVDWQLILLVDFSVSVVAEF